MKINEIVNEIAENEDYKENVKELITRCFDLDPTIEKDWRRWFRDGKVKSTYGGNK